jgi:hypothetical protein
MGRSTQKQADEKSVHVSVSSSFVLDLWDVDLPKTISFHELLPKLVKALKIPMPVDQVSVMWINGQREIGGDETPVDAGIGHGHRLNIEMRASWRPRKKDKVFISYSRKDKEYLSRLRVHLKPLEQSGKLEAWADDRIEVGDKWKEEIERALEKARIAVILVSADFLASDFIVNNELPQILTRVQKKGTRIIPVIVNHCRFARDPALSGFQCINDPKCPLGDLEEAKREHYYDLIAQIVEKELSL